MVYTTGTNGVEDAILICRAYALSGCANDDRVSLNILCYYCIRADHSVLPNSHVADNHRSGIQYCAVFDGGRTLVRVDPILANCHILIDDNVVTNICAFPDDDTDRMGKCRGRR